jgi:hypothetical protein
MGFEVTGTLGVLDWPQDAAWLIWWMRIAGAGSGAKRSEAVRAELGVEGVPKLSVGTGAQREPLLTGINDLSFPVAIFRPHNGQESGTSRIPRKFCDNHRSFVYGQVPVRINPMVARTKSIIVVKPLRLKR